jgi:hypothetical protein
MELERTQYPLVLTGLEQQLSEHWRAAVALDSNLETHLESAWPHGVPALTEQILFETPDLEPELQRLLETLARLLQELEPTRQPWANGAQVPAVHLERLLGDLLDFRRAAQDRILGDLERDMMELCAKTC